MTKNRGIATGYYEYTNYEKHSRAQSKIATGQGCPLHERKTTTEPCLIFNRRSREMVEVSQFEGMCGNRGKWRKLE